MALVRNGALKAKSIDDSKSKGKKSMVVTDIEAFDDAGKPYDIRQVIDEYVEVSEEIKNGETKKAMLAKDILIPAKEYYAISVMQHGLTDNFKIAGYDGAVSFICKNQGANIPIETIEEIEDQYGSNVVENLFDTDWNSYHLNADVMNDDMKRDIVLAELAKLNKKLGFEIFSTGTFKIKDNFVDRAKLVCKTPDGLQDLLTKSKVVIYIQKASL
jgi:hypothetical protein